MTFENTPRVRESVTIKDFTMLSMTATSRRKITAKLTKVKQLHLIESDITYIMKEKFTEVMNDRRVTPLEILRDGEIASHIAQDCFNDEGESRMCDLGENGIDEPETCRIAKALIQMNHEM